VELLVLVLSSQHQRQPISLLFGGGRISHRNAVGNEKLFPTPSPAAHCSHGLKASRPGSVLSLFDCDCFHEVSRCVQLLQISPEPIRK
jgi:hypothetical protein